VAAHVRSYLPLLLYNLAKPLVNEDVDIVRKHSQLFEVLLRQLEHVGLLYAHVVHHELHNKLPELLL